MSSAKILTIPSAAPVQPPRKTWRGALPKSVARLRDARTARWQMQHQRVMIEGRIAQLSKEVALFRMAIAAAQFEIAKLGAVKLGTDMAEKSAWYLEVMGWPEANRAAWESRHGPTQRPY